MLRLLAKDTHTKARKSDVVSIKSQFCFSRFTTIVGTNFLTWVYLTIIVLSHVVLLIFTWFNTSLFVKVQITGIVCHNVSCDILRIFISASETMAYFDNY